MPARVSREFLGRFFLEFVSAAEGGNVPSNTPAVAAMVSGTAGKQSKGRENSLGSGWASLAILTASQHLSPVAVFRKGDRRAAPDQAGLLPSVR